MWLDVAKLNSFQYLIIAIQGGVTQLSCTAGAGVNVDDWD